MDLGLLRSDLDDLDLDLRLVLLGDLLLAALAGVLARPLLGDDLVAGDLLVGEALASDLPAGVLLAGDLLGGDLLAGDGLLADLGVHLEVVVDLPGDDLAGVLLPESALAELGLVLLRGDLEAGVSLSLGLTSTGILAALLLDLGDAGGCKPDGPAT